MLLIPERQGRLPLRSISVSPLNALSWICADGLHEQISSASDLANNTLACRNLSDAVDAASDRGLLVAEVPPHPGASHNNHSIISHWLLRIPKNKSKSQVNQVFECDHGQFVSHRRYSSELLNNFRQTLFKGKSKVLILDGNDLSDHRQSFFDHGCQSGELRNAKPWSSFAKSVVFFVTALCIGFTSVQKKNDDIIHTLESSFQNAESVKAPDHNPIGLSPEKSYFQDLSTEQRQMLEVRQKLNTVPISYRGRTVMVLDVPSRILLTQEAAKAADLASAGLNWKDLYGVIHAETAWIPRDGMGRNGVVSSGLAQMEPATAKGLGIEDPNDDVDAIFGAARLMHQAATWSHKRISRLSLPKSVEDERLREGVSIFYNTSSAQRRRWTGMNTDQMPTDTIHHISNTRMGKLLAQKAAEKITIAELSRSPIELHARLHDLNKRKRSTERP